MRLAQSLAARVEDPDEIAGRGVRCVCNVGTEDPRMAAAIAPGALFRYTNFLWQAPSSQARPRNRSAVGFWIVVRAEPPSLN